MNIQDLRKMGAFISTKPIKRTIEIEVPVQAPKDEWDDPDIPEFTGEVEKGNIDVFFKHITAADQIMIARAIEEDQLFTIIHRLVVNEDGTPLFESVEQAKTLANWLSFPLINAIEELTPKKSKTPRATSSGSNSALPSEDVPRKSGKKR